MEPLYTSHNTKAAFQLNWGVTLFWREKPTDAHAWFKVLQAATEADGVRILKHHFASDHSSQFFVSTKPQVPPSEIIRSIKGRLQTEIREHIPKAFRRNYSLRSIGSARRTVVEDYVAGQLGHHRMADPRVDKLLARFQRSYTDVDLRRPRYSAHGQYWYNLHLVLVNEGRWTEIRSDVLQKLSHMIEGCAVKHEYRLSRVGMLADHIHMAMGCPLDQSPESIALVFLNNCAFACEMKPVFRFSYYVGTFGEYDRGAV